MPCAKMASEMEDHSSAGDTRTPEGAGMSALRARLFVNIERKGSITDRHPPFHHNAHLEGLLDTVL